MPDNRSQSSFIPKSEVLSTPDSDGGGSRRKRGGSALVLVSLGLFISAIIAAGGLFVYKLNVTSTLAERQQELKDRRSAFDPAIIDELGRTADRLNTAQSLVNNHIAFTPIFSIIESATLSSVRFNSMQVEYSEAGNPTGPDSEQSDEVIVAMEGIGPGYPAIALQSSELADHEKIKNPILSNFQLSNEGNVEFSVEFNIPKEEVLYNNTI